MASGPMQRKPRTSVGQVLRANRLWKDNQIARISRVVLDSIKIDSGVTHSENAFKFKLSDIASNAEFTSVWDKWRLIKVKMQFFPRISANLVPQENIGAGASAYTPYLLTYVDTQDATAQPYTQLVQEQGVKTAYQYKPFTRWVYPRASLSAYDGTTFTANSVAKADQWFDTANTSVEYYSLKWATPDYGTSLGGKDHFWDVVKTYYLEFQKVK
jgi:hypothetical protein